MNKFYRIIAAVTLTTVASLGLASCTSSPEKKEIDTTSAITTYESFINDVYNHKVSADDIYPVSEEVTDALQADEQEKALELLKTSELVNVTHVTYPEANFESSDTEENGTFSLELALYSRVLGIMSLNTAHDDVSVKIKPESVSFNKNDKVFQIERKGIVFSSKNNEQTQLADLLNNNIGYKSDKETTINVLKTQNGLKVDLSTTDF